MTRDAVVRLLFVIALVGAAVMIVAAIVDFTMGLTGWSVWTSLICGVVLAVIAAYRLVRPFPRP
ncbi:MAG TPA: hypothetical protein VNQ52_04275 [Microbacteriaceae bacterium]|nr:hypothetical protein [Microbacteriaceae bacterium]